MTRQQSHLESERAAAGRDLRDAVALRNWMSAVIAGVIVLVAFAVFEGLRRGITDPLSRLGADAREAGRGHFDRPIVGTGPADLRRLASDVESMRLRMVEELQFSEEARSLLDEQAADLKRSNTELEQFAYVASHDLQEPLRKVSSFTQLLQRRYGNQLDERADQYIAFAVDGANRMQKLINDLLAFSRVGRVHNDHQTVDLDAVLNRTLDDLSVAVEESGTEITHDGLTTVVGDTTQLTMLWRNLLSNAIKFRDPDRPPRIHVGATRVDDLWEFAVSDNGIDPEFQDKVFILFQRLHTKDTYPGTGIGLAMCKKIVEFHGGTIRIDPDHRPGTRVVLTLPAVGDESTAPERGPAVTDPAAGRAEQYHVLLVEDDDGDALLVEELLFDTDLPHTLARCRTAADAHTALEAGFVDCVLLDLHLPDASGVETVQAIQTDTQAAIIVLTGLDEPQAGVEALAAGAQDYLIKGKVDPDLIQRAVRYAVQRKQAERANAALQIGRLRAEENARLERGLLPQPLLSSSAVTASSRYYPGRAQALLGGDFLDVVQTDDGQVHAIIGDVSGHGPDAAALGVCLRIAWRALTLGGHRDQQLLHLLEQIHVAERTQSNLFTTCTLITLNPDRGILTLHLAGHHEPLLVTADGAREVSAAHGIALGIAPGLGIWPASTLTLPVRGALIAYTDGLIEGFADTSTTRLGVEGLLQIIDAIRTPDPGLHLDHLIARTRTLNADRHTDDLAVLRLDWDTGTDDAQ
ncbi:SpoIIE family protein phosphatase [Streptomyces sp. NBC_00201]|nr:SpoIIE family protein phosphatase [Streptomyces sp. NBC_00452]MCX5251116.1 SpoIIE family protein phosphatase [Streptomyces sp. NBC_00201]MCX5290955.1 SpoIIE family protein phosphatase [Streptomyces sp. NBC_00183]